MPYIVKIPTHAHTILLLQLTQRLIVAAEWQFISVNVAVLKRLFKTTVFSLVIFSMTVSIGPRCVL